MPLASAEPFRPPVVESLSVRVGVASVFDQVMALTGGGPAGADEEEHDSQERVARCDRKCDCKRKTEDRDEDDRVHRRMSRRVEREPEVVEVEEAAREP